MNCASIAVLAVIDATYNGMTNIKVKVTRQAVNVQSNTKARFCNHCFSGKAKSTTYSESVFAAYLSKMQSAFTFVYCLWPLRIYSSFLYCHKWHDFRIKGY